MKERDPLREFQQMVVTARTYRQQGQQWKASQTLKHASTIARGRGVTAARPWLEVQLAVINRYAGRYRRAGALLESAKESPLAAATPLLATWIEAQARELDRIRGVDPAYEGFDRLAVEMAEMGDGAGSSWCLNATAQAAMNRGGVAAAHSGFRTSFDLALQHSEYAEAGWAARGVAETELRRGSPDRASGWLRSAEAQFLKLGYLNGLAYVSRTRASVHLAQGNPELAMTEGRRYVRALGVESRTKAYLLETMATAANRLKHDEVARGLHARSSRIFRGLGVVPAPPPPV